MTEHTPDFYTVGPLPEIPLGFASLPTYYAIISLTYCLAILWFYKRCEQRKLSQKTAMDIALLLLLGGFVGARLFHILFEQPSHYLEFPIEVFYVWQGGFVFYGGFLTAYLLAALYARKQKLEYWLWHDTLAPVLAGGYALGRLACFMVGCCYGRVCDLPWAYPLKQVEIESGLVTTVLRHPTQLYASAMELGTLIFLLWYEKQKPAVGRVFLVWVVLHALGRIVMEFFRDDPRGGTLMGLSISTMISLFLLTVALSVLVKNKSSLSSH
jgi:phosphatidylglycerol:prolipoprotein diacylglycerol transferase